MSNSKSKKIECSGEKSLIQSESEKLQCNKTSIKNASSGKISESGTSAVSEVDVNQIGVSLNKYTAGFEAGRKLKIMLMIYMSFTKQQKQLLGLRPISH